MPLSAMELQRLLNKPPVKKRPAGVVNLLTDSEPEDGDHRVQLFKPQSRIGQWDLKWCKDWVIHVGNTKAAVSASKNHRGAIVAAPTMSW